MAADKEIEQLKEATRLAHVAIKDVKAVIKDAKHMIQEAADERARLEAGFRLIVKDRLEEIMAQEVKTMGDMLVEEWQDTSEKMTDQLMKKFNEVLYGNTQGRGESILAIVGERLDQLFDEMDLIATAQIKMRAELKLSPEITQTEHSVLVKQLDGIYERRHKRGIDRPGS